MKQQFAIPDQNHAFVKKQIRERCSGDILQLSFNSVQCTVVDHSSMHTILLALLTAVHFCTVFLKVDWSISC